MFRQIAVEIYNSYILTVYDSFQISQPSFVTVFWSSCVHLYTFFSLLSLLPSLSKVKNLALHFTSQSLFQVFFQMQLNFEEKAVVTRVLLQKLSAHLVCDVRVSFSLSYICMYRVVCHSTYKRSRLLLPILIQCKK